MTENDIQTLAARARKRERAVLAGINEEALMIRARDPKMTIEKARAQALEENPELYEQYRAAHVAVIKSRGLI